jgi:hypothetical protein
MESGIFTNTATPHIYVKDALLDKNVLEFVGKVETFKTTDFERHINKAHYSSIISMGKRKNKKCKLIAKGFLRNAETQKDAEYLIEIPNAEIVTGLDLEQRVGRVSDFDLMFNILSYNEEGDLYKLHIQ